MEARTSTLNDALYPLKHRLQLLGRNSLDLLRELAKHPSALLGAVLVALFVLMAIFAPQISPRDPTKGNLREQLIPPVWEEGGDSRFPLGTDVQGRDLLSRVIYGARISLWVGILAVGISASIGTTLGAVSGYYRGWLDALVSRFADLLMAFPFLIFAIGMMAFLGPGFTNMLLALTLKGWVVFFRLARGAVMAEKTTEYVEAAKVVGQSNPVIIVSEIMPNIFHSVLVLATLRMGSMIITEASLSFLGLGIQPPTPAWGSMVADGRDYLVTSWWIATLPGLAILVLVLSINLFGEGLRDILDPRLKVE
jgi:ABC-type dipeptide/oligopeptide/nickel transport system permease subunit